MNSELREATLRARGYRCERGFDHPTEYLDVHHKDGNTKNNVDSNLEVLCRSCHCTRHSWLNPKPSLVPPRPPYEGQCEECGSTHVVRAGFKTSNKWGKRQRVLCQDCGRTFYPPEEEKEQ